MSGAAGCSCWHKGGGGKLGRWCSTLMTLLDPKPPALPELFPHTFLGSRLHISARSALFACCHWPPIAVIPGSGPRPTGTRQELQLLTNAFWDHPQFLSELALWSAPGPNHTTGTRSSASSRRIGSHSYSCCPPHPHVFLSFRHCRNELYIQGAADRPAFAACLNFVQTGSEDQEKRTQQ